MTYSKIAICVTDEFKSCFRKFDESIEQSLRTYTNAITSRVYFNCNELQISSRRAEKSKGFRRFEVRVAT